MPVDWTFPTTQFLNEPSTSDTARASTALASSRQCLWRRSLIKSHVGFRILVEGNGRLIGGHEPIRHHRGLQRREILHAGRRLFGVAGGAVDEAGSRKRWHAQSLRERSQPPCRQGPKPSAPPARRLAPNPYPAPTFRTLQTQHPRVT